MVIMAAVTLAGIIGIWAKRSPLSEPMLPTRYMVY